MISVFQKIFAKKAVVTYLAALAVTSIVFYKYAMDINISPMLLMWLIKVKNL